MSSNPVYNNRLAIGLMAATVIFWSGVPLLVALSGGESPFVFTAAWRVGIASGCFLFILIAHRPMIFNGDVWRTVWDRVPSLPMLFWGVSYLELAFYAWATQFVAVSTVAALYEIWPIFMVIVAGWIFRTEARYRRITPTSFILFLVALVGVAAIIASQVGGLTGFRTVEAGLGALVSGLALTLAAAVVASLGGAFGVKWATNLAEELPDARANNKGSLELFAVAVGLAISNLFSLVLTVPIGFALDEAVTPEAMLGGVAGGLVIGSVASIAWRKANMITSYLQINVMFYLTPAVALIWLFAFSLIGDVNVVYLLGGATLIIIANIGIYFETRESESQHAESEGLDIPALIAAGESDTVEFKSTLRVELKTGKNERYIENAALKEIAAFLNARGGTLIIGVADDGSPVGIEPDKFESEDKMSQHLTNIGSTRLGDAAMAYVASDFFDYKGVRVLAARCRPSPRPVFAQDSGREHLYIRSDRTVRSLPTSEVYDYIADNFPDRR